MKVIKGIHDTDLQEKFQKCHLRGLQEKLQLKVWYCHSSISKAIHNKHLRQWFSEQLVQV